MRYVYWKLFKKNSCPIHISQMYDYVFNEEEMKREKKTRKRRQEEKKHFLFSNHQVRTGCGF